MRSVVCLVLVGCTDTTAFTDLPNLGVRLQLEAELDSNDDEVQPMRAFVAVGYDARQFDECPHLDVGGTLNGTELSMEQPGGGRIVDETGEIECYGPSLITSTPALFGLAEPGRLEVHDDRGNTIDVELPPQGRVVRSPTGWTFAPGQHVALDWSNTTDLGGLTTADVYIGFMRTDNGGFSVDADAVTSTQLLFTVPDPLLATGEGSLIVSVGPQRRPGYPITATTCKGAVACELWGFRTVEHTATFSAN